MPRKKRLHFKDLNFLRIIAAGPILVFSVLSIVSKEDAGLVHDLTRVFSYILQNSFDFFFFISAFLLTSHALREYKYNKSFSFKNFLIRRSIRIAPLFIVLILFAFIVHPWFVKILKLNPMVVPKISQLFSGAYNFSTLGILSVEQLLYISLMWAIVMFLIFYFFWGIMLKFFSQHMRIIGYILIGIGIVARTLLILNDINYQFNPLSYGIPIGLGAILADLIRNEERLVERFKQFSKQMNLMIYLIGTIVLLLAYVFVESSILVSLIPLITCAFYSFLILEQTYGKNSLMKYRNIKWVTHLGKISFGIVVYQSIINVLIIIGIESLDLALESAMVKIAFFAGSLLLSWIIADLSYNIIENPLLHYKREFKRT